MFQFRRPVDSTVINPGIDTHAGQRGTGVEVRSQSPGAPVKVARPSRRRVLEFDRHHDGRSRSSSPGTSAAVSAIAADGNGRELRPEACVRPHDRASYGATERHLIGPGTRNTRSNYVGRTGFEPVTSSVSGKSRAVPGVCRRRAESDWEPVTCEKNLAGSFYVRGRLNTLAPISGSRRPAETTSDRCRDAAARCRLSRVTLS